MSIFSDFFSSNQSTKLDLIEDSERDFLQKEIEITQGMFGELATGLKRDFYCLDEKTWIWYEEWTDKEGFRQHMTMRYEVGKHEISKSRNGGPSEAIGKQEARNLGEAADAYQRRVLERIYSGYNL